MRALNCNGGDGRGRAISQNQPAPALYREASQPSNTADSSGSTLQHCHLLNIAHKDLKPENLLFEDHSLVRKSFPPAEELSHKVQDLEQLIEEHEKPDPGPPGKCSEAAKAAQPVPALHQAPVDPHCLAGEVNSMRRKLFWWTPWMAPSLHPCWIQRRHSSGSMDDRPSFSARYYVESLHQNSRATLRYGKTTCWFSRDDVEAAPGCLSLHQTADIMTLKWTPNQLMNGSVGDLDYEKSVSWDYAMTIAWRRLSTCTLTSKV